MGLFDGRKIKAALAEIDEAKKNNMSLKEFMQLGSDILKRLKDGKVKEGEIKDVETQINNHLKTLTRAQEASSLTSSVTYKVDGKTQTASFTFASKADKDAFEKLYKLAFTNSMDEAEAYIGKTPIEGFKLDATVLEGLQKYANKDGFAQIVKLASEKMTVSVLRAYASQGAFDGLTAETLRAKKQGVHNEFSAAQDKVVDLAAKQEQKEQAEREAKIRDDKATALGEKYNAIANEISTVLNDKELSNKEKIAKAEALKKSLDTAIAEYVAEVKLDAANPDADPSNVVKTTYKAMLATQGELDKSINSVKLSSEREVYGEISKQLTEKLTRLNELKNSENVLEAFTEACGIKSDIEVKLADDIKSIVTEDLKKRIEELTKKCDEIISDIDFKNKAALLKEIEQEVGGLSDETFTSEDLGTMKMNLERIKTLVKRAEIYKADAAFKEKYDKLVEKQGKIEKVIGFASTNEK